MANGILALVLEINADPGNANAAMEAFAAKTGQSVGYVKAQFRDYQAAESAAYAEAVQRARGAGQALDQSILSNRESVRLLSEEMGVHLPRAVSGALAEMLPGINSLGGALLGAFALAELPKFIGAIKDAASALGGYTDEVRKAERADVDASTAALVHFTTIAQGTILIAQTNAALANLAAKQGNWKEEAKAANDVMNDSKSVLASLLGPLGSTITLYRAYKAAVKESSDTEGQAAELRQRLVAQLDQMAHLQDESHKALVRTAAEEAPAEEANARRVIAAKEKELEIRVKLGRELTAQVASDTAKRTAEDQRWITAHQQQITMMQKEWAEMHNLDVIVRSLAPSTVALTQDVQKASMVFRAHAEAAHLAALADKMLSDVNEQFATGLAAFIGGRRTRAGVEALWETARGIAMLAEGTWPPNPAAIVAAGLHFEAAAQYALIAGSGGGKGSGGGGGTRGAGGGGGSESGGRQPVDRGGGWGGSSSGGGKNGDQTIIHISGGNLSSNGQQQLAAFIGMGSAIGLYKFTSSGSSGISAPRY